MASSSIMSIGVSGLSAARAGLTTTGHNISNVSTPGFSRQAVVYNATTPMFSGAGYLGAGVEVTTVERQYSAFLDRQRLSVESHKGYLDTYLQQAQQIDNIMADPASGLSPALQRFFAGVQDVATNPSSVPSRQSMLSLSEIMVDRFHTLDARMTDLRTGVNTDITGSVDRINSLASEIAKLNLQIASSPGTGSTPPNDLLDKRGALISELNGYVSVNTLDEGNNVVNVFIGSGQSLVVGATSLSLKAGVSPENADNVQIALVSGSSQVTLPDSVFQGGKLGGLLAFRSEVLDSAQNSLGRVALALAQTFNAQHRLGQDLNGSLGGDYFDAPAAVVQARTTNTGTGVLAASVVDAGAVTTSDYRVLFQGGNFLVRRIPEGTETSYASLPQTIDGVTISLASGAPAVGDSFLVQPTRRAAADLALNVTDTATIAAASPLRTTAATSNSGGARVASADVTSVTGLPLPANVNLTYNQTSNSWVVSGAVPAVAAIPYTPGNAFAVNGVTLKVTGTPANGDVLTIANNTGGVSDNRNALKLVRLQTASTMENGTTTYQGGYSQMVSDVGNRTREVELQSDAQTALVEQARTAQQGLSGVNLDEEAANLVRFQQAYQASGKVLQIASQLFDVVLALNR